MSNFREMTAQRLRSGSRKNFKLLKYEHIIASARRQFIGMPVYIYKEFFLDWMGFDREAKRHFLTALSDTPGLFCGILYLRPLEVVRCKLEQSITWGWHVWRNLVFATVVR